MFRAFDKKTGELLFEIELTANAGGAPMTYETAGRQFIVVPIGGGGVPAELVALTAALARGKRILLDGQLEAGNRRSTSGVESASCAATPTGSVSGAPRETLCPRRHPAPNALHGPSS